MFFTIKTVVLKSEVRLALAKIKRNKAAGPARIIKGILSALDKIINEIYNSLSKKASFK